MRSDGEPLFEPKTKEEIEEDRRYRRTALLAIGLLTFGFWLAVIVLIITL